jgi:hypothetical protein
LHIETIVANIGAIQVLFEEMNQLSPPHRQLVIDARRDYWNLVPAALAAEMRVGRLPTVDAKTRDPRRSAPSTACIAGTSPPGGSVQPNSQHSPTISSVPGCPPIAARRSIPDGGLCPRRQSGSTSISRAANDDTSGI